MAEGRSVVEKLGGGRRYEVYLVWDEHLLSLAVAKVLRPDRAEDGGGLRSLRREAELLERLAHPVLIRGFGAVLGGAFPHVLLEYLEGTDLRRLIRRHGPVPLEQLLPLALDVASALHYLAAEGVVHLDVKPANVVVGMPARLIDLGSARSLAEAAGRRKPIGTAAYMAPEQCAPEDFPGRIGPAADVWGLGATLHHALAGEPPFPRDDAHHRQLVEDPPPLPGGIPAEVSQLVEAMLARDPADRPAAAEVAGALEPLVAGFTR